MWIVYNYLPKGRGRVYNYPPKGRWIVVTDIPRREASRDLSSAIYLALWTNPEGDNCFSIYQISWRKIKKELFVKKDVTLLQFVFVSIDSVSGIIFYDFVANWQQAKFCHFLGICWRSCFIYRYNFIFRNCRETRSYFESCPKTVNIQGYSELREPIRTRENCYPLIWWILIHSNSGYCLCSHVRTCLCNGAKMRGANLKSVSSRIG